MRAVLDIGTNTVLMLVGQRMADGHVHVVADHARITRLGQGVATTKTLQPEAIARTLAVLDEYRDIAAQHGAEVIAVATEGLRLAEDADTFLGPAREHLGAEIRLISGDEEAELSYLSIAREQTTPGHLRVLDIGGGSTELVVGEGEHTTQKCSHALGSVRLYERFGEDVAAIEAHAREVFATQPLPPHPVLHGLAGTVTSAGALLLGLTAYDREKVDGLATPTERIVALRDRLAHESVQQRVARPILGTGRGDVIVAGLSILVAALRHCGAGTLVVRDRGLRWALL